MSEYLEPLLILAGVGNLLCICAGIQVPRVLDWKNDLQSINPFSRKIFLNYYYYIGSFVFAWGMISIFLRDEILKGGPLAIILVSLMLVFWLARVLVDFLWFDAADWPSGAYFKVGHILLTAVFIFLVAAYTVILIFLCRGGSLPSP